MTDPSNELPTWEARFRAPVVGFPTWSRHAPDRVVYASNESGVWQLHAWDLASGERRRVTDDPVGVTGGWISADGEEVVWHRDENGDESGSYLAAPFREAVPPEPLAAGLPRGWTGGLAPGLERSIAGVSHADGFAILQVDRDGTVARLHAHRESVSVGGQDGIAAGATEIAGLSADETLACLAHAEHGDLIHEALRVIDARTGETVADLRDEGRTLAAYAWSPIRGDDRILIGTERSGELKAAVWHVRTGRVDEIAADVAGLVEPADWWPDASAVLLVQLVDGRHRLLRHDLGTGATTVLPTEPGSIAGARVRPDGAVWYRHQDGGRPPRVLEVGRAEPILEPAAARPVSGRPFLDWTYPNPAGQRVHGFLVEPEGAPPHPLFLHIHGGPTSVDLDRWAPDIQALADAGFLVAQVNYRGSLGFGREWRDALIGNIGWPEVEDIMAGLDDLVGRGLADPARVVIGGWSWGGYLTLLAHGMHPERFVAGIAGVPVGDYADGYEQLSPMLQAYDRALLGGTPAEVPQLMAERSPISYVDRVTAPILFIAGANDSRCPLRQVLRYTDRLAERGHPHELYVFGTGHGSFDTEERVRQRALMLDFLARRVPGVRRLPRVAEIAAGLEVAVVGEAGATAEGRPAVSRS